MLMPMGEDRSLEARVSALESEVRQLRAELLRREAREPFVAEPVMAAPVEAHAEPAFRLDLETLVGRYGDFLEDARGADRGRPQLLAEHRPVLGLGHRRVLSEP